MFMDLPDGWKWVKLQDFALNPRNDIVDGPFGSNLKASEYQDLGVPIIRLQNIDRNNFIDKNIRFISPTKAQELKRHSFINGDIVITKLGDPLGKACIVPDNFEFGIIVADVVRARVNPDEINKKYLVYAINSQQIVEQLEPLVKGSTRPRVNLSHIRDLQIPTAPLLEQERIVERIESLFTQLDAGVAGLKRAQAALKRYKASVLKAACEGRLVPHDPNDEPAEELLKRLGKKTLAKDGLDVLPDGWCWVRLDNVTQNFDGNRIPVKLSDRQNMSGEYPYYGASGIIDSINDYLFDGSYLLIAEDGANLLSRSTPIAFQASGKFWVNNHAHVVKTIGSMPLSYLEIFMNSLDLQFYVTGTAQPKLTQANLNKISVPLPPVYEQHRIVEEVEMRLSVIQELEQTIKASLKRAGRLRQAILKRAFEGRLV